MRGHKLACVTGELSTEPHSLYIIFDRFFFWQHMAGNRENGPAVILSCLVTASSIRQQVSAWHEFPERTDA